MADKVKSVLSILCKHLSLSIGLTLKIEYFRACKYAAAGENISDVFWKTLHILSSAAVKEEQSNIDFQQYDILSATKLYFAYLQYPAVEFYSLRSDDNCLRELLLAFAWLLSTRNVLEIVIRTKVVKSSLGKEFTASETEPHVKEESMNLESMPSMYHKANNILYINGKVIKNIREISELASDKAKLIAKVHSITRNVSGLPHLSVSELALMKRMTTVDKSSYSPEIHERLHELSTVGNMLDVHLTWKKKEHIFFEWMVTVIHEHKKALQANEIKINVDEISTFLALLKHVIKYNIKNARTNRSAESTEDSHIEYPTRLHRIWTSSTETDTEKLLTETTGELKLEEEKCQRKKDALTEEFKTILSSIPFCVQVT